LESIALAFFSVVAINQIFPQAATKIKIKSDFKFLSKTLKEGICFYAMKNNQGSA